MLQQTSAPVGRVFDIQKFSLHDGPGIRTVVFLKGCPMACAWCSNPGSQKLDVLQAHDPQHPEITAPDSRDHTVDEVVRVCLQDRPFYEESGGGVTLSGGEALVQHKFSHALLSALRVEGIHTAIETTAYCSPAIFEKTLALVDLAIIDVKHHDVGAHKKWTKVSNELPLANLKSALAASNPILVRIPVIPGVNDQIADAEAFCRLLKPMGVTEVQLLAFHQFGERKYDLLGWEYSMSGVPALRPETLGAYQEVFAAGGIRAFL